MGRAANTSSPWTGLTPLGLRREEPSNLTTCDQLAALITLYEESLIIGSVSIKVPTMCKALSACVFPTSFA